MWWSAVWTAGQSRQWASYSGVLLDRCNQTPGRSEDGQKMEVLRKSLPKGTLAKNKFVCRLAVLQNTCIIQELTLTTEPTFPLSR